MLWKKIYKNEESIEKKISVYSQYKPYLRREANCRCIYCGIHENPLGGFDYFHVEHYKPKSLERFAHLILDYQNLFYACAICNRFKGNDWPNDPENDHSKPAYPDPRKTDYTELFQVLNNGKLKGNFISSIYMIEKLVLNRPQLINERKERILRKRYEQAILPNDVIKSIILDNCNDDLKVLAAQYIQIVQEILLILNRGESISRYEPTEIRRSK